MTNKKKYLYIIFALSCLMGILRCSTDNIAGSTDETEIEISGILIEGKNNSPAEAALARLFSANDTTPEAALDSTYTDKSGAYSFDSLTPGNYSITAEYIADADTFYGAHLNIDADSSVDLGTDTLKAPGSISGKVSVQNQASKSGIFCYIPGTSYLAITDTGGSFTISNVPPGTYDLAYWHQKYNDTTISGVTVSSGEDTKVPEMLLYIVVDVLTKSIYGAFEQNYEAVAELEVLVTGDGIDDNKPLVFSLEYNPLSHGFSGYVRVPDTGTSWSATVIVYDTLARKTGFGIVTFTSISSNILIPKFDPRNAVPHLNAGNDTLVSKNDTVEFIGAAVDSFGGTILHYKWDLNGDGVFEDSSAVNETVQWVYTDTGTYTVQFYALDDDGNSSVDTVLVTVPDFKPVVTFINPSQDTAIWDTTVTLALYAEASDSFGGHIIGYKWDFTGDGTWDTSYTENATVSYTFSSGSNKVIFAGIDDDSNITVDTLIIVVEYSLKISAGDNYSFIVKTDGTVWGFGECSLGKLGNGKEHPSVLSPVQIIDSSSTVCAGMLHSAFIRSDGTLLATGDNREGQLGNGLSGYDEKELSPVYIIDNVEQVSVGDDYTIALRNDGSLWAWGRNDIYGQLGIDSIGGSTVPLHVIDNVIRISTGKYHTVAVKTDSSLWAWGSNRDGQLGIGKAGYYEEETSPVHVTDNVRFVDAGWHYTMIIKNDGTLWGCGSNTFGQLGNGQSGNYELDSLPVYITDNVAFVSAGKEHTMIIRTDGSLWACGNNEYGQFGNGTKTGSSTPVHIMNNVSSVSAGARHTLIIKGDGSVWASGDNTDGELGDGTTEERLTPVRVHINIFESYKFRVSGSFNF